MIEFRSGDPAGRGWNIRFDHPVAVHVATRLDDVAGVLEKADAAGRRGRWAAVVVSYEAAGAFDPAMRRGDEDEQAFPLAWVAEFETTSDTWSQSPNPKSQNPNPSESLPPRLHPSMSSQDFEGLVRHAQAEIGDGETYQVNLTFPLLGDAPSDHSTWYAQLHEAQRAPYSAWLDLGRFLVITLSPELFFELSGSVIRTRPMKGTIRRGRWLGEDESMAAALRSSAKAQAENVMIVDLLRNDVGRVAETGTVHVPTLFTLERYPTLWQMTSTVEATLRQGISLGDVFTALFPCGSVTGAPKIRTMKIIRSLEQRPRGLYTGAIGFVRPGGDCTFSVAIRTIVIDRVDAHATLGVGAGITSDSNPAEEYEECLIKGAFATAPVDSRPSLAPGWPFALLETMRLHDGEVVRFDRHLRRMKASASLFQYHWDEGEVRKVVDAARASHPTGTWRMRLTTEADGAPAVACSEHIDPPEVAWRVAFANAPIDERDPFLFNKTTSRAAYELARRGRPDVDDVLLWNARGEATESTIANLVVEIDGVRCTPPVVSGLLAGTFREELLERGEIFERVVRRGEVMRASRVWLVNSLRGWIPALVVR